MVIAKYADTLLGSVDALPTVAYHLMVISYSFNVFIALSKV
jgi:hypothetical protein